MTHESDVITLDLKGAVCPEPLMKVMDAIKTARPGQRIEATVDFSPAVLTISSLVTRQPWDIAIQGIGDSLWRITLTRRPVR
jgi:TusA-related sulfurtransferase